MNLHPSLAQLHRLGMPVTHCSTLEAQPHRDGSTASTAAIGGGKGKEEQDEQDDTQPPSMVFMAVEMVWDEALPILAPPTKNKRR